MSLLDTLNADMKKAMKARDKETLSVVRMVKSSLQNEQIKVGHDLTEDEELTVLAREMKQRKDSKEEFAAAKREDLATQLEKEMAILANYMPQQLSAEEVEGIVREVIQETNATSKADFGKVMSAVMPKVKGRADGKLVNATVKNLLS